MTAKEYLSRYLDAAKSIQSTLDRIERLRCLAQKSTTSLSGTPGDGGVHDKIGQVVSIMVDLQQQSVADIVQLAVIRLEVESVISMVEDKTLRDLLTYRYVFNMKWEDVSKNIGRTVDMTKIKLHIRALDAVQNILNHNIQ